MNINDDTIRGRNGNVVPFHLFEGNAVECGVELGEFWKESLRKMAEPPQQKENLRLLKERRLFKLYDEYIPCYPDFLKGLAKGAGIPEERLVSQFNAGSVDGCTSFALHPATTLDGYPISGQTKDTPASRISEYQVIGLKIKDGMELMTLTYPGWLFGHGFVVGGCSLFRNSISCGHADGFLPYDLWGMFALNCSTVEDVEKLTMDHGVFSGFHTTIADELGGIMGIEAGKGGYAFLKPRNGIYTHANHCASGEPIACHEKTPVYGMGCSIYRSGRLYELLDKNTGTLTSQLAYAALSDKENYPDSICSDTRNEGHVTSAAIIVEPLKREMRVTRGLPNENKPHTYLF